MDISILLILSFKYLNITIISYQMTVINTYTLTTVV